MWDKIFDINLKSSFLLTKAVVPCMQSRGGGSIVFISSIAGLHPLKVINIPSSMYVLTVNFLGFRALFGYEDCYSWPDESFG